MNWNREELLFQLALTKSAAERVSWLTANAAMTNPCGNASTPCSPRMISRMTCSGDNVGQPSKATMKLEFDDSTRPA